MPLAVGSSCIYTLVYGRSVYTCRFHSQYIKLSVGYPDFSQTGNVQYPLAFHVLAVHKNDKITFGATFIEIRAFLQVVFIPFHPFSFIPLEWRINLRGCVFLSS